MEQTGRNRQDGTDRTEQTGRNRQERTFNIEDTPLVLIIIFISFLFQPKKMESLLQWWWKDTLHVHTAAATAVGVPAAMVVERHPARTYCCSHSRCSPCCNGGGSLSTSCTSLLLVMEIHPGCLYCWLWKDTLHVNTVIGEKTHCTSARPYFQLRKDTLHIPTAGGENTLCTSILLLVESHTARVNVHTYIPYHIQLNKIKSCVLITSLFFYYCFNYFDS
jgi:hypothetical protein